MRTPSVPSFHLRRRAGAGVRGQRRVAAPGPAGIPRGALQFLEAPGCADTDRRRDRHDAAARGDRLAPAGPFAEFGDRSIWGTDWPHPNHTHVPDDGVLVDLLAQIAPSEAVRRTLLVDNPQRLYRFPVKETGQ
jgi:hypothetical protein